MSPLLAVTFVFREPMSVGEHPVLPSGAGSHAQYEPSRISCTLRVSGKFGAIPFEAAPGKAWPFGLPSVGAHSSYWDNMNNPALINFGRIIAGRTDVTPP